MRIVLDASPLTVETGGIRRYTEELATALRQLGDDVLLLCDRPVQNASRMRDAGVSIWDSPPQGWRKRWWSLGMSSASKDWQADVIHGTDFSVPYLHRHPAVLTIHDLSPWLYPQWQSQAQRIRRRTPWLLRLGRADMVITVSQAVRQEIIDYFRVSPEQVAVVPLAADTRFRPDEGVVPEQLRVQFSGELSLPRFFLFAGTLEPRKNLDGLLSAWKDAQFGERTLLILAGRLREDMAPPESQPDVLWLPEVRDEELAWLYAHALAVIYPSHYEGFGLPVLEAMQSGAPVIISKAAALRELSAGAAIEVDGGSPASLREALLQLGDNSELRQECRQRGLRRAQEFSWIRTAEATREIYSEARKRFGK